MRINAVSFKLPTIAMLFITYGVMSVPAFAGGGSATRHSVRRTQLTQCTLSLNGSVLFVGENKCFNGISQAKFHGVWIVGMEQSVFVENASVRVKLNHGAEHYTWLNINVANAFRRSGMIFDGTEHQFLVSFVGRKSKRPGLYGHMGQYRAGVLVDKLLTIQPLKAVEE